MSPQSRNDVELEADVPATMRDGTVLRADVYRPSSGGPWPTLLARLPYGKRALAGLEWLDPLASANAGFMVVVQDTRGRFASEGEWSPLRFEREDGFDTVEWAARLPGSNGVVGMFGVSYFGNTQWMAAIERPPSLAAITPSLTWSDPMDGLLARGGAVELGLCAPWSLETGAGHLARLGLSEEELGHRLDALLTAYDRLGAEGYRDLPVEQLEVLRQAAVPELGSLRAIGDPTVAEWSRVAGRHGRVEVPSFHVGGWHDLFIQGVLDDFAAMRAQGSPARLLVGPWSHSASGDRIGELSYGVRASRVGIPSHPEGDLNDVLLAWLRRRLDPSHQGGDEDDVSPVRIFVMGRNEWRDESAWPLARARDERWFLASGERLLPEPVFASDPGAGGTTTFVYDPADPVPTRGGAVELTQAMPSGPLDQTPIETRPDVCVFTSAPLQQDLEVTGRIRVVLHAHSSAPATDWVARLCDVFPDGRSFNLCDGILRLTQQADRTQRIEIDLWSTSNVFLAGHRLRVHVTSSSFPRWDRNLNTGSQSSPAIEVAQQVLHHDSERPSWIELSVVP
jgi:putative CocE/NonD family hydrolase